MRKHHVTKLALALLLVVITAACRQDMHNAPAYKPLRQTEFFPDGRSSRDPVEGTVARGFLREDKYFYSGKINGQPGNLMPMTVTPELLKRGQERFNIYCAPCHSRTGDGNGMIVQRGYRKAANFNDPRIVNAGVGHYYDVISRGWGAMPDYAAQVKPEDRWAIAAYIRVLQVQLGVQQLPTGSQGQNPTVQANPMQQQTQQQQQIKGIQTAPAQQPQRR